MPAAGTDPAYIPGLTPPGPRRPEEPAPEPASESALEPAATSAAGPPPERSGASAEAAPAARRRPGGDTAPTEDTATTDDTAPGRGPGCSETAGEAAEDPVFQVSDRRGAITADRTGVTFRLDGEIAEFDWDEIRAVEIETPRFGRRFMVTVYTGPRRWFETEVHASARSLLKVWENELDTVLDAYFDDAGDTDAADADTDAPGAEAPGASA